MSPDRILEGDGQPEENGVAVALGSWMCLLDRRPARQVEDQPPREWGRAAAEARQRASSSAPGWGTSSEKVVIASSRRSPLLPCRGTVRGFGLAAMGDAMRRTFVEQKSIFILETETSWIQVGTEFKYTIFYFK